MPVNNKQHAQFHVVEFIDDREWRSFHWIVMEIALSVEEPVLWIFGEVRINRLVENSQFFFDNAKAKFWQSLRQQYL